MLQHCQRPLFHFHSNPPPIAQLRLLSYPSIIRYSHPFPRLKQVNVSLSSRSYKVKAHNRSPNTLVPFLRSPHLTERNPPIVMSLRRTHSTKGTENKPSSVNEKENGAAPPKENAHDHEHDHDHSHSHSIFSHSHSHGEEGQNYGAEKIMAAWEGSGTSTINCFLAFPLTR